MAQQQVEALPPQAPKAPVRIWGRWATWTPSRVLWAVVLVALAIAIAAWQLTLARPMLAICWNCQVTAEEDQALRLHQFAALVSLASVPLIIGVLRGRLRWVVLGGVLIAASAYWSFGSPTPPANLVEECPLEGPCSKTVPMR